MRVSKGTDTTHSDQVLMTVPGSALPVLKAAVAAVTAGDSLANTSHRGLSTTLFTRETPSGCPTGCKGSIPATHTCAASQALRTDQAVGSAASASEGSAAWSDGAQAAVEEGAGSRGTDLSSRNASSPDLMDGGQRLS